MPELTISEIEASDVAPQTARQIALQYLSLVAPHDYDGDSISVDLCPIEGTGPKCEYLDTHWGMVAVGDRK